MKQKKRQIQVLKKQNKDAVIRVRIESDVLEKLHEQNIDIAKTVRELFYAITNTQK